MKRCAICCIAMLVMVLLFAAPALALEAREGEGGVSVTSIGDEPVPMAAPMPITTWGLCDLLLAVAAVGISVVAARTLLANKQQTAFKGLAVLFGAAVLVFFFLTNNLTGSLMVVNFTALPLGLLVLVQGVLLIRGLRRPAAEEEWQ